MKIGKLVKSHIKEIFLYCDSTNHNELPNLMDETYSKKIFHISYPFCTEISKIPQNQSRRYWEDTYRVGGKTVRASSQWVEPSRSLFLEYLSTKKITSNNTPPRTRSSNSRYKGNAIGNAQNLVVRTILSNLGHESFGKNDWIETKRLFSNCCAYCGLEKELEIDHAIPINKTSLGEHCLGNMVPSCKECNKKKGSKIFNDFLEDEERIKKIEGYMDCKNYVPLGDNQQVKMILELAYKEISLVSDRYIKILNELLPK